MKTKLSSLLVPLTLLLAPLLSTAAPTTLVTDTHGISGFELYGNGIFWWAGQGRCGGEFPFDSTVRLRGTLTGSTKNHALDCRLHQGAVYNTVRDEAYLYFFQQGVLHRKAVNAAEADAPQIVPAPGGAAQVTLPANQGSAYLDLADGYLYWASFNSGTGVATIRRMRTDGTANPTTVGSVSGGDDVRKLKYFTYRNASNIEVESIAVLTTDGRLYRMNFGALILPSPTTGVMDFAIHRRTVFGGSATYIYAAKGVGLLVPENAPPGSLVRIDANTGAGTTIYTASGQNQVLSVATDSTSSSIVPVGAPPKYLYLLEGRVECGGLFCSVTDGMIRRHAIPGSTTGWDLIVATGAGGNLRSDDQYLYLLQRSTGLSTRIQRLPSDSPAIELRMAADALEVVQNSQDLNNSVSLVANKPAFVRAYAHLTTNTTGKAKWFPSATLRGQRNGLDLPGSPLSHINNTSIDTTADLNTLRTNLNTSFFFDLPASWSSPGSVTLTFTVNASEGIPETGPSPNANNSLARTVNFIKKDKPCLVLVPMRTTAPIYQPNAPNSGLPQILARARSLLPVEDFRVHTVSEPIEKLVFYVEIEFLPCFPFVCPVPVPKFRFDPFNMQDDTDWALLWLTVAHFLSSDPGGCADTHWVGTVHRNIQNFNGIGGRSDLSLQDISDDLPAFPIPDFGTSDFLVVRMESGAGANPWDSPLGGRTLAHELGHNYGRKHIDQTLSGLGCGGSQPEGPYNNYSFDECTIGATSGNGALFGFDPISRRVLPPTVGGDLMSYSNTRWISRFTWDAISQKISTLSAASAADSFQPAGPGGNPPMLLINGFVSPGENLASIRPSFALPPGTGDARKIARSLDAMSKIADATPYRLRMLDVLGQPLGEWPLLLTPVDDARGRLGFVQFVPWNAAAGRLQLWNNGTLLAEKLVSQSTPVIALSPPVVNAAEQFIDLSWTASDPDQEPVIFTVQYSADDGTDWQTLRLNYPFTEVRLNSSTLRGSTAARLRVIATDGVRTATAMTDRFTIAPHAPTPVISGVTENQRIPFGAPLQLEGIALDAEDGSLDATSLQWNVTGPVHRTSQGSSLALFELPPGNYEVTLTGSDSSDAIDSTMRRFEVLGLRIPDGSGIVLDGSCSDTAYANAEFVRIPLANGAFAGARLVHANGNLYVSISDLPYGGSLGDTTIGLRVDVNASGGAVPLSGDLGFYVDEEGITSQSVGNGSTMPPTLTPQLGYSAAIVRGPGSWCAELCINETLIGGWNHAVRLLLHCDRPGRGPDESWPPVENVDTPQDWSPAFLGTPTAPTNRPPVALAGADQAVPVALPTIVHLDGGASYDPDGNALSYAWTQLGGSIVILNAGDSATPHFAATPVSSPTTMRFRLVVNDGTLNGAPDEVEVTLRPAAPPPPVPPPSDNGARLADGTFLSRLIGDPERRYEIQATTNFLDWTGIGHALSDFYGIMTLIDQDASQHPRRFYRGREQ